MQKEITNTVTVSVKVNVVLILILIVLPLYNLCVDRTFRYHKNV